MLNKKYANLVKLFLFLLIVNICLILLAFAIKIPLPFTEWRKGPPMHSYFAYSSDKAPKIFWVATAAFLDIYIFLIFLFYYVVLRKRTVLLKWFYFFFIFAFLGISFSTVEYGVRLFIKHSPWYTQFRPHPFLYWWNRPNLHSFIGPSDDIPKSTNSFGFRYKEDISNEKAKDEYRIFVLGDSSAFGHGVRDEETFAAQLEKMLNNNPNNYKFRVINAACPGHSTYQNLIALRQMILQFYPDMIIVANNDDHALEYIEDKERTYHNSFIQRLNIILYHSDYYLLFQRVISDIKISLLTKLRAVNSPSFVRRVSLEDYKNNLKDFIKIAKENNIQLIFIKMPINMQTLDLFPDLKEMIYDGAYPEALTRLCQDENQILIDINAEWRKKRERGLYEDFYHCNYKTEAPYHPSAEGHLRIAKRIFNIIHNKVLKGKDVTGSRLVETSLKYFIVSERQDAFDELQGGVVRNISDDKAEILFDVDTEEIKYLDQFKAGDLVRVFYENGIVPLRACKITRINRYGEAENELELFKIDHYIEGQLEGDRIKVLFHVRDTLSFMPTPISIGDVVNVIYSQGFFKPPMIRRIMKCQESDKNILRIPEGKFLLLKKQIEEDFERYWFELGKELWKKVAHNKIRYEGEHEAAKNLFKAVTDRITIDLEIDEDLVLKVIDRKAFIKQ